MYRFLLFTVHWLVAAMAVTWLAAADKPPASKPAEEPQFELTDKWSVLIAPNARNKGQRPLGEKGPVQNFTDLAFTGPKPGHPFVLGDFADDGDFGMVNGGLELLSGRSAAVRLPVADNFELEGMMEQIQFGGWFLLVGWDEGRGYSLSNATMKESGSPWFLTEYRGSVAIPDSNEQLMHYEWLRTQPFLLRVANQELSLTIGKKKLIDCRPLSNYQPGHVVLGVYETRYGPKKLRVHSLRMRAVAAEERPVGQTAP